MSITNSDKVTFHVGSHTPSSTELTPGGIYIDQSNGGIWLATDSTNRTALCSLPNGIRQAYGHVVSNNKLTIEFPELDMSQIKPPMRFLLTMTGTLSMDEETSSITIILNNNGQETDTVKCENVNIYRQYSKPIASLAEVVKNLFIYNSYDILWTSNSNGNQFTLLNHQKPMADDLYGDVVTYVVAPCVDIKYNYIPYTFYDTIYATVIMEKYHNNIANIHIDFKCSNAEIDTPNGNRDFELLSVNAICNALKIRDFSFESAMTRVITDDDHADSVITGETGLKLEKNTTYNSIRIARIHGEKDENGKLQEVLVDSWPITHIKCGYLYHSDIYGATIIPR